MYLRQRVRICRGFGLERRPGDDVVRSSPPSRMPTAAGPRSKSMPATAPAGPRKSMPATRRRPRASRCRATAPRRPRASRRPSYGAPQAPSKSDAGHGSPAGPGKSTPSYGAPQAPHGQEPGPGSARLRCPAGPGQVGPAGLSGAAAEYRWIPLPGRPRGRGFSSSPRRHRRRAPPRDSTAARRIRIPSASSTSRLPFSCPVVGASDERAAPGVRPDSRCPLRRGGGCPWRVDLISGKLRYRSGRRPGQVLPPHLGSRVPGAQDVVFKAVASVSQARSGSLAVAPVDVREQREAVLSRDFRRLPRSGSPP